MQPQVATKPAGRRPTFFAPALAGSPNVSAEPAVKFRRFLHDLAAEVAVGNENVRLYPTSLAARSVEFCKKSRSGHLHLARDERQLVETLLWLLERGDRLAVGTRNRIGQRMIKKLKALSATASKLNRNRVHVTLSNGDKVTLERQVAGSWTWYAWPRTDPNIRRLVPGNVPSDKEIDALLTRRSAAR